tara:strand:- start:316 stop:906 length:591 start_codon:yes stop_codon:yes gene_type:complete
MNPQQTMSRQRAIDKLDIPVNPCYLKRWYGAVSVRTAIDAAFNEVWERAEYLASKRGEVMISVEPWLDVAPEVEQYLNLKLQCLDMFASKHSMYFESTIKLNPPFYGSKVVEIRQSAFHNGLKSKNVIDIPTHWRDSEKDWTWKDVCENGQYYSTSSSESWPRPEYQKNAIEEQRLKVVEERRQRYVSYYFKNNYY